MDKAKSLTSLIDKSFYSAHFMDADLWYPHVRQVCHKHGFGCGRVTPGLPGTFPTFVVESDCEHIQLPFPEFVVKFFGPLYNGLDSFGIERGIGYWLNQQTVSIHSPRILAEGQLDIDWHYLIFEHVPGMSIGQVRDQLSADDWISVAFHLGEFMHQLHSVESFCLLDLSPVFQFSWERYASFLRRQRLDCLINHQTWNDLPAHLLDQLEDFILPVEQLVDFSEQPYLIHADLTADHLLGEVVDGRWQTHAIIDWGDAMTGNILYELVALHLDLFQSDRHLLRIYLEAYDLPAFYQRDFPRKALSMVMLHQFPMPARVYDAHKDVGTLQELAERLFAF